jgi:hypothetical protein
MIVFRVRYLNNMLAPHVYCRVFVATDGGTYAALGNLTMERAEFIAFRKKFDAEFIEEEK